MDDSKLKWWVLATVIVGTFLGRLDQTIVNLALPKIILDFSITVSTAGWISTAYIIANAIFVPIWGKLGDTIGRKKVYIFGFSIFILGSILAGLSWSFPSMIVFRIIQAIASSADYPTAMAILAFTFKEGRERAQALGIWSGSFAAASVFGPLLGGPLIDNFGWRSVFLINLPIGIIGIFMALIFINESTAAKKTSKFDWFGAITLGIVLSSLVLVLDQVNTWGWLSSNSIICYSCVIIFGIIFYNLEIHHDEPLIDLKFFKNKVFVSTLFNNFIVFMGMMGGVFLIPIFVQTYLGYDATATGFLFIPMAFCMVLAAQIGGRFVGKIKSERIMFVSTLIASIGLFLFGFFMDPKATALDIIIPLSVMAFGMGLGMAQRTNAIAVAVPKNEIGVASSILALARNIAGAFGIAIFTAILTSSTESHVMTIAKNTIINTQNPLILGQITALIGLKAQVDGFITVFNISALIVFIGAIIALFTRIPDTKAQVHVEA